MALKERQAYEGRGVNSPWTLAGSSPSPSSQADTLTGRQSREEILPEARTSETRTRKHSKNVRFSEDPPKVTQVDTDEPPSPQITQNSPNKTPPKKKGEHLTLPLCFVFIQHVKRNRSNGQ